MKLRMLETITGTRNGKRWPPPGATVDIPKDEAQTLIAQGRAEPVRAEKAVKTPKGERR